MLGKLKYIDIHGHVNFPEFEKDQDQVVIRAEENGVGIITVGTAIETSTSAISFAKSGSNRWATVGIHPTESDQAQSNIELELLAKEPKVVAIGECGLDYFHSTPEQIPGQKKLFERHIELANKLGKPLMLHIRNSKSGASNAYGEVVDILKQNSKVRANFHFFAGNQSDLKKILDLGCTVSFTGVLTFTSDYNDLVKYAPLESIMAETDCPYVAPIPYRGKRNEPSYVIETVKAIARIRGEDEERVRQVLLENAISFFKLV